MSDFLSFLLLFSDTEIPASLLYLLKVIIKLERAIPPELRPASDVLTRTLNSEIWGDGPAHKLSPREAVLPYLLGLTP